MNERKKKSKIITILALLVVAIAVIIGFSIYNAPLNRLSRQLDLGKKYLEEENYEQAVVEFDKAIAIDPMNERAYIGKAEAYVGMGDYEQAAVTYATALQTVPNAGSVWDAAEQFYLDYAQIYIDDGDYEKAVSILEEGYDLLGSEKLHDKIGELIEEEEQKAEEERRASGMADLHIDLRSITVNGYDLLEDHFAEIRELYPTGEGYEVTNLNNDFVIQELAADGSRYYINNRTYGDGSNDKSQELWVNNEWCYTIYYQSGSTQGTAARLMLSSHYDDQEPDYEGLSVPIRPGNSYDDWCDAIQIDQIKENGSQPERDGDMVSIPEGGGYSSVSFSVGGLDGCWVFMTNEYRGIYRERKSDDRVYCELEFQPPTTYSGERRVRGYIHLEVGTDGIINRIEYGCDL